MDRYLPGANHFIEQTARLVILAVILVPLATLAQKEAPAASTSGGKTAQGKPSLKELLNSDDPKMRAKGIQMVVRGDVTKAQHKLNRLATDDSVPGVRRLACWAIGEMKAKGGVLTLKSVIRRDSVEGVREAAKLALIQIEGEETSFENSPPGSGETAGDPTPVKEGLCQKDTDCKGERICKDNMCQDLKKFPTKGWALEASIIGFVGTAAVGGLTIYAALNMEKLLPSIPLAASATLITIIVAPSVKSGSLSVRDPSGVPGSLTLRVLGWICFGLHLGGSVALAAAIPFHWLKTTDDGNNWTPEKSWVISNGAVGMASLLLLSAETLVARHQAVQRLDELEREKKTDSNLTLIPFIAPTAANNQATGAIAGLGGRF